MRADDDGFNNGFKRIMKISNTSEDDLKILIAKRFIIPFETGVIVIKHWRMHNYLRNDRYKPTAYQEEKARLQVKENGAYSMPEPLGIPDGYQRLTQVSIGKDRIDEVRKDPLPPEAVDLAKLLNDLHLSNIDPKAKRADGKTIARWAEDISKIQRIDGRSWGDIEAVVRWVKTPGQFWAPNIMSGATLRKQFDRLVAEKSREKKADPTARLMEQVREVQAEMEARK
jgi:hypothetical protein